MPDYFMAMCLTVTGKTMAENLAEIAPPDPDGQILKC
jgi:dihydroxy-acid dehydratase